MYSFDKTLDDCLDRSAAKGLRRGRALGLALVLWIVTFAVFAPRVQWGGKKQKQRAPAPEAREPVPPSPGQMLDGR
jgi:hypothetical protein